MGSLGLTWMQHFVIKELEIGIDEFELSMLNVDRLVLLFNSSKQLKKFESLYSVPVTDMPHPRVISSQV